MKTLNYDDLASFVMRENNIRNIRIQKYYSLKWFFIALHSNTFTFQKPSSWEDPVEDFISKLVNNAESERVNSLNITNSIFAMSTTSNINECDGMWRNFAQKRGVLIYTTTKKILSSIIQYLFEMKCFDDKDMFENNYDIQNQLKYSIKVHKIQYTSDSKIANFFRLITLIDDDNNYYDLSYMSLSKKRLEFAYENEYRIFIIPTHFGINEHKFLPMGNFKNAIHKIVLSPFEKPVVCKKIKRILQNRYGFTANSIENSKLYDLDYFKSKHRL